MPEYRYYYAVVEPQNNPKMVFPSPNKSLKEIIENMKGTQNEVWTSQTIYNRILALCEQRGWTAYRLAELAGISVATIYTYRRRVSMPKIETLIPICNAFGISLAKFFMLPDSEADELYAVLSDLSKTSRNLLKEVALRMKE